MTKPDHRRAFRVAARSITRAAKGNVVGIGIGLGIVTGALAMQTTHQTLQLNKTMQFVATSPEAAAPAAHDLPFGPFTEAADRRIKAGLALTPAPGNQTTAYAMLSEMGSSHYAIMRNAVVLDSQMVACRMTPETCSPPLEKFRQLIDTARTIPDPTTKALLVNAWVNTAIAYDDDLVLSQKNSKPRPAPDMVETLTTGKGICDQQAQLKLYALSRAGIPQEDLRYVALMVIKEGRWVSSHAVTLARLDGKTAVLNGQQYDKDMPHKTYADIDQRLAYNSALQDPRSLLNLDYNAPFRQGGTSLMPLYSANYVTAQPYQGMLDGEKPPYYRGSAFARYITPPHETLTRVPALTPQLQQRVSGALADALLFQYSQQATLTLPPMKISAAEARRPQNGEKHSDAAPAF